MIINILLSSFAMIVGMMLLAYIILMPFSIVSYFKEKRITLAVVSLLMYIGIIICSLSTVSFFAIF